MCCYESVNLSVCGISCAVLKELLMVSSISIFTYESYHYALSISWYRCKVFKAN